MDAFEAFVVVVAVAVLPFEIVVDSTQGYPTLAIVMLLPLLLPLPLLLGLVLVVRGLLLLHPYHVIVVDDDDNVDPRVATSIDVVLDHNND